MIDIILGIHRLLVALLVPHRIRKRMGDDLRHTFELALQDARRRGRVGPLLWREAKDLVVTAVTARGGPRDATTFDRREVRMGRSKARFWRTVMDDLTHAVRSLKRSPGHVAFIVGTLGLAIGATTTIYTAARHTILEPVPYEDADRMVGIFRTIGQFGLAGPDAEIVERWSAAPGLFEWTLAFGNAQKTMTGRGEAEILQSVFVPENFFSVLDREPVLGRSFTSEEVTRGDRVVVLGHDLWRGRFGGDPDVLGTTVTLDGDPWTVIGVGPHNTPPPLSFVQKADVWLPLEEDRISTAVGILASGLTLEEGRERIDGIVEREHEEGVLSAQYGGTLRKANQLASGRLKRALYTLGVAVGFLLIIACLNTGSLLINRADTRRHETGVRIALGIGRGRLFRQHLLESLVLAALAAAAGLGVAWLGIDATRALRPEPLSSLDRMTLDGSVLLFAIGVTVLTGLLFGLMPAMTALSRRALDVLRTGARDRENRRAARARWVLVVGEVALSFAILAGSGLLVRTVWELSHADPGFRAEGLAVVRVDVPSWKYEQEERPPLWDRLESSLESIPGVEKVALTSGVPTRMGIFFGQLELEGREVPDAEAREIFHAISVSPEYFEVLGQRVVAGRPFTPDEIRGEEKVYILSQSTARTLWPDDEALGRGFKLGGEGFGTVVGIVDDVVGNDPTDEPGSERQLYSPVRRVWSEASFAIRTSRPIAATLEEVRKVLRSLEPDVVVDSASMETVMAENFSSQRFTMVLLISLAAVASLLASLGLYGVVAQIVARRTREIGIRMSLGADRSSIRWMMLRSGMGATVVGILVGTAAALVSGTVLQNQLVGVEPTDPATLLAAAVLLGLAALLATWLPARKAARTDPLQAISSE